MKRISIVLLLASISFGLYAQKEMPEDAASYRRSSLYNILITHPSQKYSDDVLDAYAQSPFPDKFNDHSLSITSLISTENKKFEDVEEITRFLNDNHVGQRMVAKWFNRDKTDGTFDVGLLAKRGLYNANQMDQEVASMLKRGSSLLEDAGAEMISNTFVVVYDIVYIDKEENAQKAKQVFKVIGQLAKSMRVMGGIGGNIASLAESTADLASSISDMIAGFTVRVTSHLYQLDWNDEVANTFYTELYIPRGETDLKKKMLWSSEKTADLFKLKYVDSNTERSAQTVTRGLYSPQDVIRKVINRSMDEAIVALQNDNEVFRVKVPVLKVEGDKLYAAIGKKEGVNSTTSFEVLESVTDQSGRTRYRRVGVVKANKVWDNRYMAEEEEADGSDLNYTEFKITGGSNIYPGMLLHEGSSRSLKGSETVPVAGAETAHEKKAPETNERTEQVQTSRKAPAVTGPESKGKTMVMAVVGVDAINISHFSMDKLSYGIQAGWARKVGVYGKFRTNFVFQTGDGTINPNYGWSNGNSKISYYTATAGIMIAIIPQMYINVGAGYGSRTLLWETPDKIWREVSDYSMKGVALDASILGRFGKLSISVGANAIVSGDVLHLEPELGIGVMF